MNKKVHILAVVIAFFAVSNTVIQAQNNQLIIKAANEIINSSTNCGLITLDDKGHPSIRMMDPFKPDEGYTIWMATNPNSKKVTQIQKNPKVTLYYTAEENQGYVMLQGMATIVNDPAEKSKRWKPGWEAFYPNKDKDYVLIKVSPLSMEVVSFKYNLLGNKTTWQAPRVSVQKS